MSDQQGNSELDGKDDGSILKMSEFFMGVALLSSQLSEDPRKKVGACIVNKKNEVVGTGYNCMPDGCNVDFPWTKDKKNRVNDKITYVCHAEMNAIINKNVDRLTDCEIYVTCFPCNECARLIIQSGIIKVFYMRDEDWDDHWKVEASQKMFKAAKIPYSEFEPNLTVRVSRNQKIAIDVEINGSNQNEHDLPSKEKK